MRLMSRSLPLRSLWQIVSQINLAEIQQEIEAPFHLLIAADMEADAAQAARRLSAPDAAFAHPWITVTDSAGSGIRSHSRAIVPQSSARHDASSLSPRQSVDCAVLVTPQLELSPALTDLQRILNAASIPSLVVVTGPAAQRPDGAIARRGEQARVAIEDWSDESVDRVASSLLEIAPARLRLALARRLPPLRSAAFHWLIQETSQANATYSFTTGLAKTVPMLDIPLNVGDAIVLTKNQMMMAYKIALVAGKTGTPQQLLGELIGVLGGGFLFRQLARGMIGLIPGWGIVPKVAVAYAGTWTVGQAVVLWAVEGQHLTPALLKSFYQDALRHGQRAAQEISANARGRVVDRASATATPAPKSAISSRPLRRVRRRIHLLRARKLKQPPFFIDMLRRVCRRIHLLRSPRD